MQFRRWRFIQKILLPAALCLAVVGSASIPAAADPCVAVQLRLLAQALPIHQESTAVEPARKVILIISDAHMGKVGGLQSLIKNLDRQITERTQGNVKLELITSADVPGIELKGQSRKLSTVSKSTLSKMILDHHPYAIHILTEGPLGRTARNALIDSGIPFTTSYTIQLPEYAEKTVATYAGPALGKLAKALVARYEKHFHAASKGIMVATPSLREDLIAKGYEPDLIRDWSRGVDTELFHPSRADPRLFAGLPRPITIYAGRVSVEKNIEDFLDLQVPGTKVVVGDGDVSEAAHRRHPEVVFFPKQTQEGIAKFLASADIMVFPSLTDTFGQVQLEANASGIPVAAYAVPGPIDVIRSPDSGALAVYRGNDRAGNLKRLEAAWESALHLDKRRARAYAETWSWGRTADQFLSFVVPIPRTPAEEFGSLMAPESLEAEQALLGTTPLFSHPARWEGTLLGRDVLSGLVSPDYRPANRKVFPLPSVLVPWEDVAMTAESSRLGPEEKKILFVDGPDGKKYLRYFIHPDSVGRPLPFSRTLPDPIQWWATALSSGRTLLVKPAREKGPGFLVKTSVFRQNGRYKRNIDAERAMRAVRISDELARIHDETSGTLAISGKRWDFLPEPFAMTTEGDESSQAGFILRSLPTEIGEDIVLPWYALIARRPGQKERWIDRLYSASGKSRMEDFLWEDLMEPATELHSLLSIHNGLTTELHQQNLRVRIDRRTLRVKGLVIQDMDAHFVDHSLRAHYLRKLGISQGDWETSLYLFRYGLAQKNQYQSYIDKLRLESFEWVLNYVVPRRSSRALLQQADELLVKEFNDQFPGFAISRFEDLEKAWDRLHESVTTPEEQKAYSELMRRMKAPSFQARIQDRIRQLNGRLGPHL